MRRELTCIRCPIGCQLVVETNEDTIAVTGNSCPRGVDYGTKEVTNPTRIVTSSVKVFGGKLPLVSVKTANDIPKEKIFDVMAEIRKCTVYAPIHTGDIVMHNVAGTGTDIIATKTVDVVI